MYSVKIHERINQSISLFYRLGLWHRGDNATIKETIIKLVYSIYYLLLPISFVGGSFSSKHRDESIFLVEAGIVVSVLLLKLLYIIWKKDQIIDILNRICVYSMEEEDEFNCVNNKINRLMKFATVFFSLVYLSGFFIALLVPFLGSEKSLFFNIAFPLDWKTDDIAYWLAFTFIFTEAILTEISMLFSPIIWYLMINCALRYEILGHQIKNMGVIKSVEGTSNKRKISNAEKEHIFLQDLVAAIESHKHTKEYISDSEERSIILRVLFSSRSTNQLESFLSTMFLIQISTGSICICGSTYSLAFNSSENVIEYFIYITNLLYNTFDIFMVMYFGNSIIVSSDRISYCLFESNWVDQPQSTKKDIIIFGELVQQPHQIVMLTLYSLNLETFTRILNSAYSLFNILMNFK